MEPTKDILNKTADELLALPDIAIGFFEHLPDAAIVVDKHGKILFVNNEAELMFGYHRNELKGMEVEVLVPDAIKSKHTEHRAGYMKHPHLRGMGVDLDLKARAKDGNEFTVTINLSPFVPSSIGVVVYAVIRRK
jgi:PAS domain S-box-containing protein